jgi:defect in organelle trafficking protein DotA
MKKLFTGLFLFLLAGSAFAFTSPFATTGVSGISGLSPVANHTDLSIAYLAQVFGTVGNSLQGTSGQMLGMLFMKLNQGIMVVAGIWLAYTVATLCVRSAMDGSFMGPNKNVFWVIVRIALAFAMLLPGPATGYSIIQDVVMKITIEGVSLADQTWAFGLNYISAGGSLWHDPAARTHGMDGAIITPTQAATILTPAQQIFQNEVCMVASSGYNQIHASDTGSGVTNSGSSAVVYSVQENNTNHQFNFPGNGATSNNGSGCGSVAWSSVPNADCSTNSPRCQMAHAAVSQMIYQLLPVAKQYACTGGLFDDAAVCSGVDRSNMAQSGGDGAFNALVNYANAVYPIAQNNAQGKAETAKKFIPNAEAEGWMMAGRYYWDLGQIQESYAAVQDISSYVPTVNQTTSSLAGIPKLVTSAGAVFKSTYIGKAQDQLKAYSDTSNKGNTGDNTRDTESQIHEGNWVLSLLLGPIVTDVGQLFMKFTTAPGVGMGSDPIVFLHSIGSSCLNIAGDIWLGLAVAVFGISAATVVCQGTLNLDTPVKAITDWMKPVLMGLATALFGVGVLLGFYTPLYPFMLFTFGVIGWIISVIEAMVAAPLVAFGLTHPEGHDFLGEAKQALMLLLGVFLRPVLMVIGLIAGMILSYVSLRILVYSYSGFLYDVFYNFTPVATGHASVMGGALKASLAFAAESGSVMGLFMTLFVFPMFLAVFAMLVYVVTNQCFSLIYVLPDYILRWIGGPQQSGAGASPLEMVKQAQGAMGQIGSTASGAVKSGIDSKENTNKHLGGDDYAGNNKAEGNKTDHTVGTDPATKK